MTTSAIVVICYNHSPYIKKALTSVAAQRMQPTNVIIVDNGSTDGSKKIINDFLDDYPTWVFINNKKNEGNIAAFNKAIGLIDADYVTDLSADDELTPDYIADLVEYIEQSGTQYGFIHTDAWLINHHGNIIGRHISGKLKKAQPPKGYNFGRLFEGHFICAPSVMFNLKELKKMGGYNALYAYEDFPTWMELARNHPIGFVPKPLVMQRKLKHSASSGFGRYFNNHFLRSTADISQRAFTLCKSETESQAVAKFTYYHLRQAMYFADLIAQKRLINVLNKNLNIQKPNTLLYLFLTPIFAVGYSFIMILRKLKSNY